MVIVKICLSVLRKNQMKLTPDYTFRSTGLYITYCTCYNSTLQHLACYFMNLRSNESKIIFTVSSMFTSTWVILIQKQQHRLAALHKHLSKFRKGHTKSEIFMCRISLRCMKQLRQCVNFYLVEKGIRMDRWVDGQTYAWPDGQSWIKVPRGSVDVGQ